MANNGFIAQGEADAAKTRPIKLHESAFAPSLQSASPVFAYPVEEIRQQLEDKYTTRVAQGGLTVYSTINAAAQKEAYFALREGLRVYDRGHSGWRGQFQTIGQLNPDGSVQVTPQQLASYHHPDWYEERFKEGQYLMGLITKVDRARNEATAHFGAYDAVVTAKDMGRATGRQPKDEFKVGYLGEFKIKTADEGTRRLTVEMSQPPAIEGAIMTVNAKNGEIVSMVGGYDFNRNKFNNATQADRQTGSCFKPFIYTAAVEWGMTPDTVLSGAPLKRGSWTPHNYDGSTSCGDTPMKIALAKSLNIPAVHALDMVGIQTGSQMVRRFGITRPMAPYLPSALGATEVPLAEMVSAYSAFPGKGVRHEKHLIRRVLDREGNTLEEWEQTTFKVVSEYVALTMVDMMRGVTSGGGTAPGASSVGAPGGGQDRHGQRPHGRVVHRLHGELRDGRVAGLPRDEEEPRRRHDGRPRRPAHLDRLHEGLPQGQAEGAVRQGAEDARGHPRAAPPAPARADGGAQVLHHRRPEGRRRERGSRGGRRHQARTGHAPARRPARA